MFADVRKPAGLFAIVAALAVLSAGCIVQDRPHEAEFSVLADAGQNKVIPVGETAHFEWAEDHAVKAEAGEPPHVEVEYAWTVGQQVLSENHNFSFTGSRPDLVIVELNVTAKQTTASDAVGVLVVPGAVDGSRRLYVASVGGIMVASGTSGPAGVVTGSTSGAHGGYWFDEALPAGTAPIMVHVGLPDSEFALEPIRGALLFAVKDGSGSVRTVATGPLEFEGDHHYKLWIDPTPAGHHTMQVFDAQSVLINNTTLEAFEAAHAAEEEVEVLVVDAQTLPGFEGLAAVATMAVLGAVLVAARRRL